MATGMETWPAVKLPGVRITITNYKTFQRVWCIHQPVQKLVFRLKGPPISSHNPLDGLRGQPCELVRNWTSPETMKRKKTTPKVVNLPGHSIMSHLLGQADHSLGQRWKRKAGAADNYWSLNSKKVSPQTASSSSTKTTLDTVRSEKWPAVTLYLDELLG